MTYLIFVAMFGTGTALFLWLRDARIFFRTGLPGYRKAAYYGVLYGALASLGYLVALTMESFELLGLGLILAALYLQGKIERERVRKEERMVKPFFGSVPAHRGNKKSQTTPNTD
jgi:hypothetical protein